MLLIQLFDTGTSQNMMGDSQHKCPGEYLYQGILMIDPVSQLYAIKQFEFQDEDVFLATYPKSGNNGSPIYLTSYFHEVSRILVWWTQKYPLVST